MGASAYMPGMNPPHTTPGATLDHSGAAIRPIATLSNKAAIVARVRGGFMLFVQLLVYPPNLIPPHVRIRQASRFHFHGKCSALDQVTALEHS